MTMKTKILFLFCALFVQTAAFADTEKPVTLEQLPAADGHRVSVSGIVKLRCETRLISENTAI